MYMAYLYKISEYYYVYYCRMKKVNDLEEGPSRIFIWFKLASIKWNGFEFTSDIGLCTFAKKLDL